MGHVDHRDSTGVNVSLTEEDRKFYKDVILHVYPYYPKYNSKKKVPLSKMSDAQLMAFGGRLISKGQANFNKPQIYLRAIIKFAGGDTWIMDTEEDGFVFAIGLKDRTRPTQQIGKVHVDKDFIIKECTICGETHRRFEGMKLRNPELK
jgi:hypothetical protein